MAAVVFIALGCSDVSTVGGVLGTCDLDTGISEIKPRRVVATLLTIQHSKPCFVSEGRGFSVLTDKLQPVEYLRFVFRQARPMIRSGFSSADRTSLA